MSQNTLECENAVIGSLLADSRKLVDVDLMADHFESVQLGMVYDCIKGMVNRGDVADLFTVADELGKTSDKDWMTYLATIQRNTAGASHLKTYSTHIKRFSVERNAKQIAHDMANAVDSQGMAAVDSAIQKLMALGREANKTAYTLKEGLRQAADYIDERLKSGGALAGIASGFDDLDSMLGGFHDTDLIVIGARPSMGKTALLLNLMVNGDVPCGFFSAEMPMVQGALRMISMAGGVKSSKIRKGDIGEDEWSGINAGMSVLSQKQIFTDDKSKPTIDQVMRQARLWKQENNIKCLHVDYIQRIDASDRRAPKHLQVEEVAQGLKSIAKELSIPVVALAQVNRAVIARDNKRPNMSDLKDSGSIEQEADQIIMLYRDEVYTKEDCAEPGVAELNIEKNRHGETGSVRLSWDGSLMRFGNLSKRYGGY
jgi:replicative DNA helicase